MAKLVNYQFESFIKLTLGLIFFIGQGVQLRLQPKNYI